MTVLLRMLAAAGLAAAGTVTYDFNVTWVTANPDAAFARPVVGINGKWPLPRISANVGDRIVVKTHNHLGNQSTSLHFHGLFMNGTTHMDGAVGAVQCPIPPGASFTYNFTIDQPGTYWYHSHNNAQYPDGLRGPLIIHDNKFPYRDDVDDEIVLTLSDWYHDQMQDLIPIFMSKSNPTGAEPVPQSALMNDTQNVTISVEPNKTYLFRVINMAAFASQYLWIQDHTMRIVEVDGVYTEAAEADMIYLSAAQRVSFLLTTHGNTSANFPLVASMDTTLFDVIPDKADFNVTGWLVYDAEKPLPKPATVDEFDPFDDVKLVPHDKMLLLSEPNVSVTLDVQMDNLLDGANYAFFNNITYAPPKVPTLYSVLSAGDMVDNSAIYGEFTHPFILQENDVVQIVLNNQDTGRHPFHLHGHQFQVVYRSDEEAGTFEDEGGESNRTFASVPMRRDTVVVWPNGNVVLRFRANNPGVWLFHCHIEWHVVSGLLATFIEAPDALQKQVKIPPDHFAACTDAGIPTAGNAAGNTVNLLDLAGQNEPPPRLPDGFTARGIVALVFSCISGILGVAVVAWYGKAQPVTAVFPTGPTATGKEADFAAATPSAESRAFLGGATGVMVSNGGASGTTTMMA